MNIANINNDNFYLMRAILISLRKEFVKKKHINELISKNENFFFNRLFKRRSNNR